ncbi:hypothetical protein NC969_25675 [Leptolyngbya subtilissima ST-M1]|nr:hypothetical protein [Nodosilinea sp. FACHB-131]
MQLTYRGQPSKTSATVIDAIATSETATFIDQLYARDNLPSPSVSSPLN